MSATKPRTSSIAGSIHRKSFGYCETVSKYGYSIQSAGQFAPDIGMAVIANAKVTSTSST
jgi:hypothetical protein